MSVRDRERTDAEETSVVTMRSYFQQYELCVKKEYLKEAAVILAVASHILCQKDNCARETLRLKGNIFDD